MNRPRLAILLLALLVGSPLLAQRRPKIYSEGGLAAIVGDEVITYGELDRKVEAYIAFQLGDTAVSAEIIAAARPRLRREILENMIEQSLLLQEAEKEDVAIVAVQVDEEINARIKDLRRDKGQNIRDAEHYYELLEESEGMSRQEYRDEVRKDMTVTTLLWKKAFQPEFVTPGEMREAYRANIDQFSEPSELTFRMIFLKPSDTISQDLQRIDAELDRGADFGGLARAVSEVKADVGGLWKRKPDQLQGWPKKVVDEILGMEVGQIKRRIRAVTGWYYLKMEAIEKGEVKPFEDVQETIKRTIVRMRRESDKLRFVENLYRKYTVKNFLPEFDPHQPPPLLRRPEGTVPPGEGERPAIRDLSEEAVKEAPKPKEEDS